jgi:hypothetical protein
MSHKLTGGRESRHRSSASALVVRNGQPVAHLSYIEAVKSFTALPQLPRSYGRVVAVSLAITSGTNAAVAI